MVSVEINKGIIVLIVAVIVGLAITYYYEKEISVIGALTFSPGSPLPRNQGGDDRRR